MKPHQKRRLRLLGDPQDRSGEAKQGGGFMLPPLLNSMLEAMLDEGAQSVSSMAKRGLEVAPKGKRASFVYDIEDPHLAYEALVQDLLDELQSQGVVYQLVTGEWMLDTDWLAANHDDDGGFIVKLLDKDHRSKRRTPITVRVDTPSRRQERSDEEAKRSNIRQLVTDLRKLGDLSELRESMEAHGWVPEFPALIDEHGTVLVGNRRMAVARELGIEPVIEKVTIGDGDAEDSRRLRIALVSNIAHRPMTGADRKRIASYLHIQGWTQQAIADALMVTQRTISSDLLGLEGASKPSRPRGGRPRGRQRAKKTDDPRLQAELRRRLEAGEALEARSVAEEFNISPSSLHTAAIKARAAFEAEATPEPEPEPQPEPDDSQPTSNAQPATYPTAEATEPTPISEACPHCGGSGKIEIDDPRCNGTGIVRRTA